MLLQAFYSTALTQADTLFNQVPRTRDPVLVVQWSLHLLFNQRPHTRDPVLIVPCTRDPVLIVLWSLHLLFNQLPRTKDPVLIVPWFPGHFSVRILWMNSCNRLKKSSMFTFKSSVKSAWYWAVGSQMSKSPTCGKGVGSQTSKLPACTKGVASQMSKSPRVWDHKCQSRQPAPSACRQSG